MLIVLRWRNVSFMDLILLGTCPLPFSQDRWDHIRYRMCGSLVVCRCREQVVSRFMGHNRWPMVSGVQDPDSSPRAFHRAGSRSRSLDESHNRYSYGTIDAITGFDGEAVGPRPPWSQLINTRWYPSCSPR
jgi:hypothetical protein